MKSKKNMLKSAGINKSEGSLNRCLDWFYAFPNAKIGLNNLSKSINSSKTATKEAVESLIKIAFLTREIIGKSWLLSSNQKHPYFLIKKVPYHLNKIYESGIIEAIHQKFPQARAIILFGSYRWGTDTAESDIDIAIEVLGNNEIEIVNLEKISELGYRKNVPVNLHIFSRNKIDLNLFSNIANGIIMDGFLEAKP